MQVFKCFYKILWKNKLSLMIYLIIFFTLMVVFTSTAKNDNNAPSSFETEKIKVGIIDKDQTDASKALVSFMKSQCKLKEMKKTDSKAIQDGIFFRDYEYVLTIPKGYEDQIKNNEKPELTNVKVPDSFSGNFVDMKLNTYEGILTSYVNNGVSLSEALTKTKDAAKLSSDVKIQNDTGNTGEREGYYYYYSYFSYIAVVVLILGIGVVMTQFNKKDLQRRNKIAALSAKSYNAQLIFGCASFAMIIWAGMNIVGIFVCSGGKQYWEKLPYLLLDTTAITLVAVSLSFLLGSILKTSNALNGAGNTFSLGFSFLGGVFVPMEYMNQSVINIGKFVPTSWYIRALMRIVDEKITSDNLLYIWKCIGVQLAFAVLLFAIALVIRKVKTKE